jgi:hypothetical protein
MLTRSTLSARSVRAALSLLLVLAAGFAVDVRARFEPQEPSERAQPTPRDPLIGTWSLNLGRSTYVGRQPPKNVVRTFDETRDGLILSTLSQVTASGSLSFNHWYISNDGKEYPEYSRNRGAEPILWLSTSVLDAHTREVFGRRLQNGRIAVTTRFEFRVADDGKSLSVIYKDPAGKPTGEVVVFDRTL